MGLMHKTANASSIFLSLSSIFAVLLLCTSSLCAQDQKWIRVDFFPEEKDIAVSLLPHKRFADSSSAAAFIHSFPEELSKKGYFACKILSVHYEASSAVFEVDLRLGVRYRWLRVGMGNLPPNLAEQSGLRLSTFNNQLIQLKSYQRTCQKILSICQNKGLPFAALGLDSIEANHESVSAVFRFDRGDLIRFDSITSSDVLNVPRGFLASYLKMPKGGLYSEKALKNSTVLLKHISFLEVAKSSEVIFKDNRAYPILYVRPRRASEVDGMLGFMPNEARANAILLTGQVRLNLQNVLNSGKNVYLFWQQFLPKSPQLEAAYTHYNLFNLHLDMQANFSLIKQDTSFQTLKQKTDLLWRRKTQSVGFFAGLQNSSLLSKLPSDTLNRFLRANTRYVFYGFKAMSDRRNSPFFPTRGFSALLEIALGNKKLNSEALIKTGLFEENTLQWLLSFQGECYLKLRQNVVAQLAAHSAIIEAPYLLRNDLLRVGGLKTLRGFNENAFFVSQYAILNAELRLLIGGESFLYGFGTGAALSDGELSDRPYSFGLGLCLNTGAGLFNFAYSLGSSNLLQQGLALNRAKIHFGLNNRF